jgi:transcription initiation factor TFIIH subunit 1
MAIAHAVSAGARADSNPFEDSKLVGDVQLQRSLLQSNHGLRQRFEEALGDRPESISISQFSTQFWAARVHLLRAHAAEKAQGHGTYNVLSVVKPRTEEGVMRLNLSKEQIQLIFNQHPLVKRVYNETVPALSEGEFWSRFFGSRLFKKLKGEKITEIDPTDPKLDKYLNIDENAERLRPLEDIHVPHYLDLEGNEQNHSQKLGNQPDLTMRPNSHERVPILRVLNSMSEKMMADVAPADGDTHDPVGMDEETFNQLQLLDLQKGRDDNRIRLNIREQKRFFAGGKDQVSAETAIYLKQNPKKVIGLLKEDLGAEKLGNRNHGARLETAIGVDPNSDSEDDDNQDEGARAARRNRMGTRAALGAATTQLFGAIRQQRLQTDPVGPATSTAAAAASCGLSEAMLTSLTITQNTTVEFLQYFWSVYLSGDDTRATELQRLVETLDKSLDRIKAAADQAEKEREERVAKARKQIEEYQQRTGKRRRFDPASIKGGAKAVNGIMGPTVRAIASATSQYRTTLETQLAASQAQATEKT